MALSWRGMTIFGGCGLWPRILAVNDENFLVAPSVCWGEARIGAGFALERLLPGIKCLEHITSSRAKYLLPFLLVDDGVMLVAANQ